MSALAILTKCPLAKCPLAKCPLAKCRLAKCPLAKCPDTTLCTLFIPTKSIEIVYLLTFQLGTFRYTIRQSNVITLSSYLGHKGALPNLAHCYFCIEQFHVLSSRILQWDLPRIKIQLLHTTHKDPVESAEHK